MSEMSNLNMRVEKPFVRVTIEKAKQADMPIVIHIYKSHEGDCTNVGPHNTYVAKNPSGIVVGAVTIFETDPRTVVIRTGGVDKDFGRMGVGKQLFEGVAEEMRKKGYHTLVVAYQSKYGDFYTKKLGMRKLNSLEMVIEL